MDIALILGRINPAIWTRPSNPATLEDIVEWGGAASLPTQQELEAEEAVYLAEVAAADAVATQVTAAQDAAEVLMGGLGGETPRDQANAVVVRSYIIAESIINSAPFPQATIDGITDRATAFAYVTTAAWFTPLTAGQKTLKRLDLEAQAVYVQALIAALRR